MCIRRQAHIGIALIPAILLLDGCRVSDAPDRSGVSESESAEHPSPAEPLDGHEDVPIIAVAAKPADPNPIDGPRAYEYLKQICELGPRITGTAPMQAQQQLLAKHFEQLGGQVRLQDFSFKHPQDESRYAGANLIVQWHPETTNRILLCAHYDTRPQPDNRRVAAYQRGNSFIGANDGASGVALLMELAHYMSELESQYGVDFLLLDAEEFVFNERQRYFIGSEFFARDYVRQPPKHTYRKAALLDMIGDRGLQIYQDRNSVWWKDTRPVTEEIWATARQLGISEFIARTHPKIKNPVRDDHLMLRNVGKIPTCQIIDFDYPKYPINRYWHTAADTPERCSGESLAKVGWVMLQWLRTAR